jgi:hypothetical protein
VEPLAILLHSEDQVPNFQCSRHGMASVVAVQSLLVSCHADGCVAPGLFHEQVVNEEP